MADAKGVIAAAAAVDVVNLIRSGCTLFSAYDHLSAAADSGSDDYTQDYLVGSRYNRSPRLDLPFGSDRCRGLVLDGVAPGVGVTPSNMLIYLASDSVLF
jgi:hypothetical protein